MSIWSNLGPVACAAEACQCEAPREALIRQPSSFWSSISYLVAAFLIFRYVESKTFKLKMWTFVCSMVGFSSLVGHGSFTRIGLAIDFSSIIVVLSFFVIFNFTEKRQFAPTRVTLCFVAYYTALFTLMYSMEKWYKIGFCIIVFLISFADLICEINGNFFKEKILHLSFITLILSLAFFLMDEFHIRCHPESLFQWHSVWHCGTAISIFFYGVWRFAKSRDR